MGCYTRLDDILKGYTRDLDKQIPPEETVKRFKERLAKVDLDILEGTARVDNGRLGIPVYFSLCGRDAEKIMGTKKQMGKGGSEAQAEASAVMELVERFSLFSFANNDDNFLFDEYTNIRDKAMPFDYIAISVNEQNSEDVGKLKGFFEHLSLRWCRACDFTIDRDFLIPFDWFYAINQFNGSSAGNCKEEAILQGLCEVVERHVSCLVSRGRIRVPRIDPESVSDPLARELMEKFKRAGVRLYLHDLTLGMGIPTVGALAYDPATFPEKSEIVWTAGTCTNPEKALIRALTEVAQLGGDFNTGSNYVASGLPKFKDIEEGEFLTGPGHVVPIDSLPDISDINIKREIEASVSCLEKNSMDVIGVDLTHGQLDVPAFYIIVPGAQFRERAENASLGMFLAKLVCETQPPFVAVEKLEEMESLLGDRYYLKFYMGLSWLSLDEPASAERYFREALKLDPSSQDIPSIYSYLGVCLKEQGRYREAIDLLETGIEYDDERVDIHNLMGFCFFKEGEHEKAIRCFERVIEIDPSSAIDYANIASNYRELGRIEDAIQYYRLALELDPSIEFARENLKRLMTAL